LPIGKSGQLNFSGVCGGGHSPTGALELIWVWGKVMKKIFVLFALALAFVGSAAIITTIKTLSAQLVTAAR
jgi:hypothetical protein